MLKCPVCDKGVITAYVLVGHGIVLQENTEDAVLPCTAQVIPSALLMCPECDALTFLAGDSKKLAGLKRVDPKELAGYAEAPNKKVSELTEEERSELYQELRNRLRMESGS